MTDCGLDCEEHAVIELALAECAPTEEEQDEYLEKAPAELPGLVRALREELRQLDRQNARLVQGTWIESDQCTAIELDLRQKLECCKGQVERLLDEKKTRWKKYTKTNSPSDGVIYETIKFGRREILVWDRANRDNRVRWAGVTFYAEITPGPEQGRV